VRTGTPRIVRGCNDRAVVDLSHLGTPVGPMTRVEGKGFNRLYRLDTDEGSFAVKELNHDRIWAYRHDMVFRFEQAACAAGIPMPEPISASADALVHRWVDGEPVPEEPVPVAFAFEIGAILARIHALDVEWSAAPTDDATPRDWAELAERSVATGQPWADELASHVDTLLAIAHFVDSCERPGPVVLTHKDVHPWNLLARDGRPVVLDWELSGMLDLASELGSTALSLSKGAGFDDIDPAVFGAVLDGYVEGGGALPSSGPSWFVFMISGWLGFTRWNIVRCLAGVDATTGPDLARCHEEVRNGLHGLPDMFGRLRSLEDLLP
jgi:aminoglycoside phosphotransferase (APT) family kinase protein